MEFGTTYEIPCFNFSYLGYPTKTGVSSGITSDMGKEKFVKRE